MPRMARPFLCSSTRGVNTESTEFSNTEGTEFSNTETTEYKHGEHGVFKHGEHGNARQAGRTESTEGMGHARMAHAWVILGWV